MASTGRPPRVLIIVENLPVPFDRRVWSEATTLRNAGYDVTVICPTGQGAEAFEETIDGVRVYRHTLSVEASGAMGYFLEYGLALWHELRLALKVWRRHGIDVIHACNPPDLIFLVALPFKLFGGVKFIFDHHDLCPELYEAKFGGRGFGYKVMSLLEKLTFRLADVSIATNNSYRRIAIERGGMRADRSFVVRSGPNLGRIRKLPVDARWRRGRQHLVGYVGVMGKQEGIDLYLEAIDEIVHRRGIEDIQFVICGSGPELAALRRQASEMKLDAYVDFLGRVDDETLLSVLSSADVCANPDRFNEMNDKSTMNKIMEYMALEKPIVQFDVTEGRFSAGEASLYAKPNDPVDFARCILDLLADPERRERMGSMGRERVVSELSWPHQIPVLLQAYETALGRPVPAANPIPVV
jgi:glycosyltransferase involved in cell wall biosynthesis